MLASGMLGGSAGGDGAVATVAGSAGGDGAVATVAGSAGGEGAVATVAGRVVEIGSGEASAGVGSTRGWGNGGNFPARAPNAGSGNFAGAGRAGSACALRSDDALGAVAGRGADGATGGFALRALGAAGRGAGFAAVPGRPSMSGCLGELAEAMFLKWLSPTIDGRIASAP